MSKLFENSTTLEEILTTINNLPNAGGGLDTSDATATSDEIFKDKTAYTAGGKVTGTFTIENELNNQENLISQIQALVQTKATPSGGDIDHSSEDMLVSGGNDIAIYENSRISSIASHAFEGRNVRKISCINARLIGENAFKDCRLLSSVTVSSRLYNGIGKKAFCNCMNLPYIELNVGSLGGYAFKDCINLRKIKLNYSYDAKFATDAFEGCTSLSKIILDFSYVPSLADTLTFLSDCPITGIYVPNPASFKKATGWSRFADIIKPLSEYNEQQDEPVILETFKIDHDVFYTEPGMTWGEWIYSPYNIGSIDGSRNYYNINNGRRSEFISTS